MKVCIPIERDHGMDSPVCRHFGAAPAYLIVDTEAESCRALTNRHGGEHGKCVPVQLLRAENVDALIVSGIGRGALVKLAALKTRVFQSEAETVGACIAALQSGALSPMAADRACTEGHHHG